MTEIEDPVRLTENPVSKLKIASLGMIVALLPTVIVAVFLYALNSAPLAMIVMHWVSMVGIPLVWVRYFTHSQAYYPPYIENAFKRWRNQVPIALFQFVVFTVLGFYFFYLFRCDNMPHVFFCIPTSKQDIKALHLDFLGLGGMLAMGLYFVFVNPVVEEWFWRIFLYRDVIARLFAASSQPSFDHPPAADIPLGPPDEEAPVQQLMDGSPPVVDFVDVQVTELGLWVLSALYASYHIIVVWVFASRFNAAGAFMALTVFGRWLIYCRNNPKLGMLSALLAHTGVDFAVILSLALVWFQFLR
eukprot:Platyproteum_vivax@DN7195_c0_g1_i1.p1